MAEQTFTIIDDGRQEAVGAHIADGCVRLSRDALRSALGVELKPEGLCAGTTCIPVSNQAVLVSDGHIDLAACAEVLARPLALDVDARVAFLGVSAADRAAHLRSLQAPDFTLPDLHGTMHSLSDYRGMKVLLLAFASW